MLRSLRGTVIVAISLFIIAGCDNLSLSKPASKKSSEQITQGPPTGVTVVAKVGSFYISADDLNKEVEAFNSLVTAQGVAQNKIDTREKKLAYLRNELVRKYMLYQEALDRGLDRKEDIVRALESAKISLLVSELVRQELEKIEVSDQDIQDFYNQNKDSLREPEQRKILELVTDTEDQAKQAYIELLRGADFAAAAKQYSKAPTASKGGDLGYMYIDPDPKKRAKFDKFYEIAFSPTQDMGSISSIFKGPDGYYIIKVDNIKKSEAKSLNELKDNIKSWLLFEKQQKAIADLATRLQGETKIEVYEGKVD